MIDRRKRKTRIQVLECQCVVYRGGECKSREDVKRKHESEKWNLEDINMELKKLPYNLTICKVADISDINLTAEFYFIGKTDEELSLVCRTEDTPSNTTERDDGWRGFRIQGVLDFSIVGILAKLSGILAENRIGIFAVSTYNTDYIFVKAEALEQAIRVLVAAGYTVI